MGVVEVSIPVDEQTAEDLRYPDLREAVGRIVSRMMERRRSNVVRLFGVMDRFAAEARANGLTDEIIAEELAAYNAERRKSINAGP